MSDEDLVRRLRAGDESAFAELINAYHPSMVRLAQTFVSSQAIAEEVAQETWLAVLKGIDGFEGRSSLKTWIFRILANRARSTGAREQRIVPVDLGDEAQRGPTALRRGRHWSDPPAHWCDEVVERLSSGPFLAQVQAALASCPRASAP